MISQTSAPGLWTAFVLSFTLYLALTRPALAQNLSPILSAIADLTVAEDTPTPAISFTVHDAETAAANLTVTATSSNPGLVPTNNIAFAIVPGGGGSNRTVTVTPLPNQFGSATINLTVRDAGDVTDVERFILTVASVNDRPTLDAIRDFSFCGCVPQQTVALTGITSGATNENQTLTVTATSSNPSVVAAPAVTYTSPNTSATLAFTPLNFSGTSTINVTVNDGGTSNSVARRTFTVTVTGDTPPVVTCPANFSVECGTPWVFGTPAATDACGSNVTIQVVSTTTNTQVTCPAKFGAVRVWHATDACGNTATCSQTVFEVDTTPPIIRCPSNAISVTATTERGSVVTFLVSATSICSPDLTPICTPPSGALFPPGTNMVTCRAVDTFGNTNSCSFSVTVLESELPRMVIPPSDLVVLKGDAAIFNVVVTPKEGTLYRWMKDTVDIPGASARNYVIASTTESDAGDYAVAVSIPEEPGIVVSSNATLTVLQPLSGCFLRINELQTDNRSGVTDRFGEFDPWIEIYNTGRTSERLANYFLSDRLDNLTLWPLPVDGTIDPGQFRMVWLDGQPEQSSRQEWHAPLRTSSAGLLILVRVINGAPEIADILNYSGIGGDRSFGAPLEGAPFPRRTLFAPTPGTANIGSLPPVIVAQPRDSVVPLGGRAVFSVAATSDLPTIYDWRLNGLSIPGANGSNYVINAVHRDDTGNYSVMISSLAGDVTSAPFTLRLLDAEPPMLHCPTGIVVTSMSAFGTSVKWSILVTDDVNVDLKAECVPRSGSLFRLGVTRVSCTARDLSGNRGSCTFNVTVTPPPPMEVSRGPHSGELMLRWSGDRVLQMTDSLAAPVRWRNITSGVTIANSWNQISIPHDAAQRFFRCTYSSAKQLFGDAVGERRTRLARDFMAGKLDTSAHLGLIQDVRFKVELANRNSNFIALFAEGDADGDLVPDRMDRCPRTPINTVTDEHGCPDPTRERPPAPDDRKVRELLARFHIGLNPNCTDTAAPAKPHPLKLGYNNVDRSTFKLAIVPASGTAECPTLYEFQVDMQIFSLNGFQHKVADFLFSQTENIEPAGSTRAVFVITQQDLGMKKLLFDAYDQVSTAHWRVRAITSAGVQGHWSDFKFVGATPSFGEP